MQLKFLHKQPEAGDAISFTFRVNQPLSWHAGQYMVYDLKHEHPDNRGSKRYFTIATAPFEKDIQVTTRISDKGSSSFKKALNNMKKGQILEAIGPKGDFLLEDPKQHSVFIAGGIGITPFRSILLDLEHRGLPIHTTLLYANKTSEFVYKTQLEHISALEPNFQIHYIMEPEHITKNTIKKLVPNLVKSIFYISGPPPMVDAVGEMLSKLGILSTNIKEDYFSGYNWP